MAEFVLSAFADEYSPNFDEQLEGLKKHGIGYMEIRGVDGKNVSDLTEDEMKAVRAKLDAAGIGVSSIGSPIGKIKVTDDFDAHMAKLANCIKAAHILGTKNIRIFSFYMPEGMTREEARPEVMRRLGAMLELAKKEDVVLCHENEKAIYGESAECCLDIQKEFGGEIKLIFDPANFIMDGHEPYPHAYDLLGDKIYYMHIKDASAEHVIAPAGKGVGRIPEILADLDKKVSGKMFLTVEPHLRVFKGFDALERDQKTTMPNTYATSYEAFGTAVDAIKAIIA
ncbi:MAG: sugar phosphate isomerase/epimerase [Clostridia bacterium]|nr:sugar phosphate isomerase/epimerase [Clostridia bacterium]